MFRSLRVLALLIFCHAAMAAPAQEDGSVPGVLRDWRAWVLKDQEFRNCPFLSTQAPGDPQAHICAWPGRLALDATATGARFSVHWRVEAAGWVVLPGDGLNWPQQVRVNRQPQPVLGRDGEPALWLAPGSYDIEGFLPWRERPQALRVSEVIGIVALSVDGKVVAPVQREGDMITLGRSASTVPEADSLDLHVFRELADGVPAELTTQIRLAVSGQAREETLGPALPTGFEPTALTGAWPARLDGDGRLHVQVSPGAATLVLRARAIAPLVAVAARLPDANWPKQEIWSYRASPQLRVTSASAALAVDPRQAQVPDEWLALPAFALGDAEKITIDVRSRGLAANEANRLTLRREAWLDFAGDGWYARDAIGGSMVQGWRFDVAAPFTLERAQMRGEDSGALLVTRGASAGLSGVEWREPVVDLSGSVRIDAVAAMPATGWQQTFDRVDTTLHLPFGYQLLGAPGADSVVGSWLSRWSLLDAFVCAIVVLLAWRLLGVAGALATAGYLLLGYQESGSPRWTLLAVLALALIAQALPGGRLQQGTEWLRRLALLVFAIAALPFLANQVRYALYAQLEGAGGAGISLAGMAGEYDAFQGVPADGAQLDARNEVRRRVALNYDANNAPMAMPAPPPPAMPSISRKQSDKLKDAAKPAAPASLVALESKVVPASQAVQRIDRYSSSTVVQTGAGEPSWRLGSTALIGWSGPVLPTQTVHLVIAPPWLVRPLRLVLVVLLAWLAWRAYRTAPTGPRAAMPPAAAALSGMLLLAGVVAVGPTLHAQEIPSDALLGQLRERMLEAPKCAPACADVAQAQVSATGDEIEVALDIHAGARVAVALPGIDSAVELKSIKMDGVGDVPVAGDDNNATWIAVERGVHRIQIQYAAHADKLALNFSLKPERMLFAGKGWSASGIDDDRLLSGTLSLARERAAGAAKPEAGAQQFPPYVRLVRTLALGLDWSVATAVDRVSPASGGFTLNLPLLAGEHVSTPGMKVLNGDGGPSVTVAVADGSREAAWTSTLDKSDALTLTAPTLADRAEVWRIAVSPTWHVEFSGVPRVASANAGVADATQLEFHPLPGETLTLKVTRPTPVSGAVRAIDSVKLDSQNGQRSALHTLSLSMRSSQGGEHVITLPKDVEIVSVQRDGEMLNLRAQDGKLSLPLRPGVQRYAIRFRDNTALGVLARTPQIALGLPAANITLTEQLPADRWLLATLGPPVGPAVLYWGELVVMVAIAFVLARTRRTRLKFHDWLLLGLGFSTFSWMALIFVVAWLFAFDWRGRREPPASWWRFDLAQLGLIVLTVVAIGCLISAIPHGLLGQPDMHVSGYNSYAQYLQWFADRSVDFLPQARAITVPMWVYKVLMLLWALWLANALMGWLREGFVAWTTGGYWRSRPPRAAPVASASAAAGVQPQ